MPHPIITPVTEWITGWMLAYAGVLLVIGLLLMVVGWVLRWYKRRAPGAANPDLCLFAVRYSEVCWNFGVLLCVPWLMRYALAPLSLIPMPLDSDLNQWIQWVQQIS